MKKMMKSKGMARGGRMKSKGMAKGGRMAMKSKGYAKGGKMKSKGAAKGGKKPTMTLAQIRAAAKAKGYKIVKA
jgi:hypothetical protein